MIKLLLNTFIVVGASFAPTMVLAHNSIAPDGSVNQSAVECVNSVSSEIYRNRCIVTIDIIKNRCESCIDESALSEYPVDLKHRAVKQCVDFAVDRLTKEAELLDISVK